MYGAVALLLLVAVYPADAEKPCNAKDPKLKELREGVQTCFKDIIEALNDPEKKDLSCHKATDLEQNVKLLFNATQEVCPKYNWEIQNPTLLDMLTNTINNTDTFNVFYNANCTILKDAFAACYNKSSVAVVPGHITWVNRFNLNYDSYTCDQAKTIKNCAITNLTSSCPKTVPYVELMYEVDQQICVDAISTTPASTSSSTRFSASTSLAMITLPLIIVQYLLTYQR